VARFLFLNITFETKLLVWEDDKARTIRFMNAQEGFMKKVGAMAGRPGVALQLSQCMSQGFVRVRCYTPVVHFYLVGPLETDVHLL